MFSFTLHKADEENIYIILRSFGCFNGYIGHNSMTRTSGIVECFNFRRNKDNILITREDPPSYINDELPGKFLGLGWLSDHFGSRSADIISNSIKNIHNSFPVLYNEVRDYHLFDHNKEFNYARILKKRRIFTKNELEIREFFKINCKADLSEIYKWLGITIGKNGLPNWNETTSQQGTPGILKFFESICSGVPNIGYDIVGSDRSAGFCVAYLMSYRNISNVLTSILFNRGPGRGFNELLSNSLLNKIMEYNKGYHFDLMFVLGMIAHNGSDSEIFVHAGQRVTAFGMLNGFFGLERFFIDSKLEQFKRYHKGEQSLNLCQNTSKDKTVLDIPQDMPSNGCGRLLISPVNIDYYNTSSQLIRNVFSNITIDNRKIVDFLNAISTQFNILNKSYKNQKYEDLSKVAKTFKMWIDDPNKYKSQSYEDRTWQPNIPF